MLRKILLFLILFGSVTNPLLAQNADNTNVSEDSAESVERNRVVIATLHNLNNNLDFDYLSGMLPDATTTALESLDLYDMIPRSDWTDQLEERAIDSEEYYDDAVLLPIAKEVDAYAMVIGYYILQDEYLIVTSRIIDVESGKVKTTVSAEADLATTEIFTAVDEIALTLAEEIKKAVPSTGPGVVWETERVVIEEEKIIETEVQREVEKIEFTTLRWIIGTRSTSLIHLFERKIDEAWISRFNVRNRVNLGAYARFNMPFFPKLQFEGELGFNYTVGGDYSSDDTSDEEYGPVPYNFEWMNIPLFVNVLFRYELTSFFDITPFAGIGFVTQIYKMYDNSSQVDSGVGFTLMPKIGVEFSLRIFKRLYFGLDGSFYLYNSGITLAGLLGIHGGFQLYL